VIEIVLVGGIRVRVDAGVSEAALKRVLSAVKAAA
jgi:transposase